MDNSRLTQQLQTLLLCGAGLLFAVFLGWVIGTENYQLLVLGTVILTGLLISFFMGRFLWVVTIASSFLGGTFPILGGAFTPFQILMLMGVAKFIVEDVVMRRTRTMPKSRFDLLMIAGFMGVLTFHGLHDRFGMRFLGSSVWGGHNYVNVFVGLAAFFVVQSIPMQPKVWAKLPYVVLAVTTFDLLIAVITTIYPSSIFKIYPFYSAVSVTGIEEALTGESLTGRVGSFGNFGFILILLVLASIPLRQILNPKNLHRFICLIIGFVAVLFSGFRSAVLNTVIGFLAAGIRDLKYAIVLFLPFLALGLFALSFVNSDVFQLPKQVQRSLAFLPGKWDADMARDAASSNDFRKQVWTIWIHDYFPVHPWLGRGFGFKSDWAKPSAYNPKAIDYRQTVEVQNIHNGLFATLDTFGIVGTIFFVLWNLRILARTFRVSFQRTDAGGMTLRFLALYLAVWIIAYWFGALHVGTFLPQEFALVAVFLRLRHAIESKSMPMLSSEADVNGGMREELVGV
ncbi:MAG: O-antigen ligase family protein [Chthoniobacterales bacterium]